MVGRINCGRKGKEIKFISLENSDWQPFKYENEMDMMLLLTNLRRNEESHQKLLNVLEPQPTLEKRASIPQPQGRYRRHVFPS